MKIAVVGTRGFPGVQGGVESHCENLYPLLVEAGCDVTVFAREPYTPSGTNEYRGVTLVPLNCPKNKFLEALVHTFKATLRASKVKADILHIHAIGPSLLAPLARLLGMKVVVTHHGPDYKRGKWSLPAKLFLKFCEWVGMKSAHEIITIADNIAADIKRQSGREAAVIPNGVQIPANSEAGEYRKKHNLMKNKYILSVGRFVPEKGFSELIDAYNEGDFQNWNLVIVGDADHEDNYSRKIKEKARNNRNIVLTGFLKGEPLHELYSNAGLFVLPSYYEGLPIVLLEAMSYGLSCIASDIPANRNIRLDEERFFNPGDVSLLADKMNYFIRQPWEEDDIRSQLSTIAEEYDWRKIADETLKVYELLQ